VDLQSRACVSSAPAAGRGHCSRLLRGGRTDPFAEWRLFAAEESQTDADLDCRPCDSVVCLAPGSYYLDMLPITMMGRVFLSGRCCWPFVMVPMRPCSVTILSAVHCMLPLQAPLAEIRTPDVQVIVELPVPHADSFSRTTRSLPACAFDVNPIVKGSGLRVGLSVPISSLASPFPLRGCSIGHRKQRGALRRVSRGRWQIRGKLSLGSLTLPGVKTIPLRVSWFIR